MAQAEHTRTLTWNRTKSLQGSLYYAETENVVFFIEAFASHLTHHRWQITIKPTAGGSVTLKEEGTPKMPYRFWNYLKQAKGMCEMWFEEFNALQLGTETVPFIAVDLMEKMEELSGHLSLMAQCLRMHQEGREGEANFNASEIVGKLDQTGIEVRGLSQDLAWWLK
ncbi:MAG: hypothetical protein CL581_14175 [Alteromonadaceae bacterium]|nr:hypothetical protein [Alteromonadaceae bacterium]|tara:strand:- start:2238 stop:2738 length:501 start_codon:yes stop_codon:yes gene_type:complete